MRAGPGGWGVLIRQIYGPIAGAYATGLRLLFGCRKAAAPIRSHALGEVVFSASCRVIITSGWAFLSAMIWHQQQALSDSCSGTIGVWLGSKRGHPGDPTVVKGQALRPLILFYSQIGSSGARPTVVMMDPARLVLSRRYMHFGGA